MDQCVRSLQTVSAVRRKCRTSNGVVPTGTIPIHGWCSANFSIHDPVNMNTMRIIDMVVHVPDGVRITTDPPDACRVFHTLDGQGVHDVRTALESEAVKCGYNLRRTDRASYLQRGERRIEIYQISSTRLGIRVDDAESLPFSEIFENGVGLANLTFPVPRGARVEAGRERHDRGSTSWSAEWRIYDEAAANIASLIHEAMIQLGLKSGGIWPHPKGGMQHWRVEAHSPHQLVQAGITDAGDHLSLNITVINEKAPLSQ